MTDAVVKLAPVKHQPNAKIIEQLESLLAKAKAGEILAIACATENICNEAGSSYALAPGYDMARLVGAVEWLRHRLMEKWTEKD